MRYDHIVPGIFINRPNRFVAYCEIDGKTEKCHVKNTGRCRELLVPGAEVYLEVSDNPDRKTPMDLIAVRKGDRLVNMDSQVPNDVAAESLRDIPMFSRVHTVRREFRYGNSRIDIMAEDGDNRYLVEVKGVTLEDDGVVRFPDAPTERGAKHVRELIASMGDGYVPCLLFVIQMEDVRYFESNRPMDPAFADALADAHAAGVRIIAYSCRVSPDSLELGDPVDVRLRGAQLVRTKR